MKKLMSLILVVAFIVLTSSNAFAAGYTDTISSFETFSIVNENGDVVSCELIKYTDRVIARVYINGILNQESTASLANNTITTNIYDESGHLDSTSDIAISSIATSTISSVNGTLPSPTEYNPRAIVPNDPDPSTPPDRDILDEPVDNTGLVYTHTSNGRSYYYLGKHTTSGATGKLYRAFETEYIGETRYHSWNEGTLLSAILSFLGITYSDNLVSAIIGILSFTAGLTLDSNQSIELATYHHDYYYQVKVNSACIYETQRYSTYWHIANSATGITKYELKSDDGGFIGNNMDMVAYAINEYYY